MLSTSEHTCFYHVKTDLSAHFNHMVIYSLHWSDKLWTHSFDQIFSKVVSFQLLTLWITCWINLSLGRGGPHHPNLISPPPHKIIAGTIHHWIWINNITLASEDVKDEVQRDDFGRRFCLQVRRLGRKTNIFIDIQDYDYGNKILDWTLPLTKIMFDQSQLTSR